MTLKVRPGIPSLRGRRIFRVICDAIRATQRASFGVIHYSVQADHVHLIVEAGGGHALSRGVQGLAIRIARGVDRALRRSGKVFADRYHARELATPLEVRRCLVYVLQNHRKHARGPGGLDPCSSAATFDGWETPSPRPPSPHVARMPSTWLATTGWRRHGLIHPDESPAP